MRSKYIRNSLMVTCMSLALSQAYAMENLVDDPNQIARKSMANPIHSLDKWDIVKREKYTKETAVKISEYHCFKSFYEDTKKTLNYEESFLRSIEFKPKKYSNDSTTHLMNDSLFVGEKQDPQGKKSFVVLVHGYGINSYIEEQAGTRSMNSKTPPNSEIVKKVEDRINYEMDLWDNARLRNLGHVTEEARKEQKAKFPGLFGRARCSTKELNEKKESAIKDIVKKYEEGLSGKTDIERADKPNELYSGSQKYLYSYPFKYSHQSPNDAETGKFLSKFYHWGLIPDFFIDEIVDFIGIEDFRVTSNSMFDRINQRMDENATAVDFERIAFDELAKVSNPHRKNELTWTLITELNTPEHSKPDLIIALCKLMNDEKLLHFQEARTLRNRLEADARVTSPLKMTTEERYLPAIRQLLSETDSEAQRTRTTFANAFLENGAAGKALSDFSLSEQTLMDLLKLGMERGQRIKELEAQLAQSSVTPTPTSKQEEKKFGINPTSAPQSVTKGPQGTTVVTDDNGYASYQLESDPFNVTGGQKIKVHYDITVEADGVMSLGLLNMARNGWYGDELILRAGSYAGAFEWIVPAGETKTSLVFRNYRGILDQSPGQTTFTIKKVSLDY